MHIDGLGELTVHEDIGEWLVSEAVSVPCLEGAKMRFIFVGLDGDPTPGDFTEAVRNFRSLGLADREIAAPFLFKHYRAFVDAVGADLVGVQIVSPAQVWAHVRPTEVFVARRHRRDREVYIQVTAECSWEPEHGLQIVYRNGKHLSRVSDQDGHLTHSDAYDLSDNEDHIC